MREGWSRCAAEALLLGLPCLIRPAACLGDLARITDQPAPDLCRLREQIHQRATTPEAEAKAAYDALACFDLHRLIVNAAIASTAVEILPPAVKWVAPRIKDPASHVLLVSLLRSPYLGDLQPVVNQYATDYLRLHPNDPCALDVSSALMGAKEAPGSESVYSGWPDTED
ncbi:hypothetical protein [Streptomyces sp. NPDC097640]|uniref:hypothetical protein n=1 Tax=Streptomyces sp. NPDC097640 TaxID=3157229 RepID=UPI003329D16D